jgi:hypothetical protein
MVTGVGQNGPPLTKREQKAIADLKKLANRWPDTLMLFSWSGSLVVFKGAEWHVRPDSDDPNAYIIDSIDGIDNDGGDP